VLHARHERVSILQQDHITVQRRLLKTEKSSVLYRESVYLEYSDLDNLCSYRQGSLDRVHRAARVVGPRSVCLQHEVGKDRKSVVVKASICALVTALLCRFELFGSIVAQSSLMLYGGTIAVPSCCIKHGEGQTCLHVQSSSYCCLDSVSIFFPIRRRRKRNIEFTVGSYEWKPKHKSYDNVN